VKGVEEERQKRKKMRTVKNGGRKLGENKRGYRWM
jgi:hypothetical protein